MKKSLLLAALSFIMLFSACATSGTSSADNSQSSIGGIESGSTSETPDSNGGQIADGEHTDADNNGVCDDCKESVLVTFDFFAINDLHGKLADGDSHPGVDELTTYLKNARAENENTVFLSSGDMWQGASESNLTKGKIITEWMNDLEFASMTLGNHEYDWGAQYIEENAALANFPFLAINVYDRATNERVDYCESSVTVEINGVQIGIIGAIGDCYSSISADKVQDVYFKVDDDLTALVKAESQKLRAEGADYIVYSLHDGYGSSLSSEQTLSDSRFGYYDVALSNGYVDLVFEGHSHQSYVVKDSKGVYHVQGGGDNKGISHAEVQINVANGKNKVHQANYVKTSVYQNGADDPIVNELLGKYDEQISLAGKKLGRIDRKLSSTELRQLAANLYYQAGVEKWGDEYDIVLGGGFLSTRAPYEVAAGEVLYGNLLDVLPFDNPLVLCSISGAKLKSQFFETSNSNYFIGYGEYGASVKKNIQLTKTYYVVTDTYSSQYKPNGLTEIARYDETTYARDLIAKYIEDGNLTAPEEEIVLTGIPEILAIGNALADNETTSKYYYVQATIEKIINEYYGNIYLKDENGNLLYIYGLYDENGNKYADFTGTKPQVGDVVLVRGQIQKYIKADGSPLVELLGPVLLKIVTKN